MADPDAIITDERYPDLRARLVADLDAGEPYGDGLAPALIIERRQARPAREVYQPAHLDRIVAACNRLDEPLLRRYLRIVHGASAVERVDGPDLTVLVFDTADYRDHVGAAAPVDLSGEHDEWRAWLDGDMYGAVIERREPSAADCWREVGSLFGLYGRTYANQRARELIGEYATHPPTQPSSPTIRLMLDLDIGHLPQHIFLQLSGFDGVIAFETHFGWLMWVPADPDAHAADHPGSVPAEVLAVQSYARRRGCDYVRFDADAPQVHDLPSWDW